MILCDRCGVAMDEGWIRLDGRVPGTPGGNCTECGDNLCPICAGGFDSEGRCKKCSTVNAKPESLRTIKITPTWVGTLPLLLAVYKDGETSESRRFAEAELKKMAQAADLYNTLASKEEPK